MLGGCLVPDPIETEPQHKNLPPVIEAYSPTQSYVILKPGETQVFSIDKVRDEDPENLSYTWFLNGEPISNGTFIRFVAPPIKGDREYFTLEVVISDGENETKWWWTIIVTSS